MQLDPEGLQKYCTKKKHKETAKNKAQQDTMNWQRQREANRIHKEGMKTKDRKCEVTQDTQGKKTSKIEN